MQKKPQLRHLSICIWTFFDREGVAPFRLAWTCSVKLPDWCEDEWIPTSFVSNPVKSRTLVCFGRHACKHIYMWLWQCRRCLTRSTFATSLSSCTTCCRQVLRSSWMGPFFFPGNVSAPCFCVILPPSFGRWEEEGFAWWEEKRQWRTSL